MTKELFNIIVVNKKSLPLVDKYVRDFSDEVIQESSSSSDDTSNTYLINITTKDIEYLPSPIETSYDVIIGNLALPSILNLPGFSTADRIKFEFNAFKDTEMYTKYEVLRDSKTDIPYILINTVDDTSYKFSIRSDTLSSQGELKIFTFRLNPNRIVPSYRKLITEIKTRGGWEVQHWGNALSEVSVQGRSGALFDNQTINKKIDITSSIAWKKLRQLHQIYLDFNSKPNTFYENTLALVFRNSVYRGYFSSFEGPKASESNPFIVDYSFTFKVNEEEIF